MSKGSNRRWGDERAVRANWDMIRWVRAPERPARTDLECIYCNQSISPVDFTATRAFVGSDGQAWHGDCASDPSIIDPDGEADSS